MPPASSTPLVSVVVPTRDRADRLEGAVASVLRQTYPTLDVVMSDINMPVMDGLTLLSRLADVNRILKTVIVSAYGDMENIRAAMNRGAYDFLVKPRVLMGKHVPGIGLNQVYEQNTVPQLPGIKVALRDVASELA